MPTDNDEKNQNQEQNQSPSTHEDNNGKNQNQGPSTHEDEEQQSRRSIENWHHRASIAASAATIVAAAVAIGTLWYSAATLAQNRDAQIENRNIQGENRDIQADQAAHTAAQEHMRLRVENREINAIEEKLEGSLGVNDLSSEERPLYVNVAEHGIATTSARRPLY